MYAMDAFPADFYRLIFHYYAKCSQGKCYAMRWEGKREEDIAERPKSETAQFTHNKCAKSGKWQAHNTDIYSLSHTLALALNALIIFLRSKKYAEHLSALPAKQTILFNENFMEIW